MTDIEAKFADLAELAAQVDSVKPGKGNQLAVSALDSGITTCRLALEY